MPAIQHRFDGWYVATGKFTRKLIMLEFQPQQRLLMSSTVLQKNLLALVKTKDGRELQLWIKSITNHLYWVVSSTPEEDGKLMLVKWLSSVNQIKNVNHGHNNLFPTCAHDTLDETKLA